MSERKLVDVVDGPKIEFIRPSQLTDEDNGKLLVEGVFVESMVNSYNDKLHDYKFELEDGGAVVLNGAGNLGYQMNKVPIGTYVAITYLGKEEIKSGKMKGKLAHGFKVQKEE